MPSCLCGFCLVMKGQVYSYHVFASFMASWQKSDGKTLVFLKTLVASKKFRPAEAFPPDMQVEPGIALEMATLPPGRSSKCMSPRSRPRASWWISITPWRARPFISTSRTRASAPPLRMKSSRPRAQRASSPKRLSPPRPSPEASHFVAFLSPP